MFWVLIAGLIPAVGFGLIYPAAALIWYKLRSRGRLTVKQIMKIIDY